VPWQTNRKGVKRGGRTQGLKTDPLGEEGGTKRGCELQRWKKGEATLNGKKGGGEQMKA